MLARRFEQRERNFLRLARQAIRGRGSPYGQLFAWAGCELGDVERLVSQEGVEGALENLFQNGVYLTLDEFKGRRDLVRGNSVISFQTDALAHRPGAFSLGTRSGGSRGQPSSSRLSMAFLRDRAITRFLTEEAVGSLQWPHAYWVSPGDIVGHIVDWAMIGAAPVRWFSQVDPGSAKLHPRYRWSARLMRWGGWLGGMSLPRAEYVPLENPALIVEWLVSVLRDGKTPHLTTFSSAAVRVCEAARSASFNIRGARFRLIGEPATSARMTVIHESGCEAMPTYGSSESGRIAHGCVWPKRPDQMHVLHDSVALIQPGPKAQALQLRPKALLVTSLRTTAPFSLLNVSLGDEGEIEPSSCGCPLEQLGWRRQLHTVRSFEKLTAAGMTFLDQEVIHVLEKVLPSLFGGGPTDYQLVEQQEANGASLVRLLVHPDVGPLDSTAVADAFLTELGRGAGANRLMELQWRQAGLPRVDREPPRATPRGKILHMHAE